MVTKKKKLKVLEYLDTCLNSAEELDHSCFLCLALNEPDNPADPDTNQWFKDILFKNAVRNPSQYLLNHTENWVGAITLTRIKNASVQLWPNYDLGSRRVAVEQIRKQVQDGAA